MHIPQLLDPFAFGPHVEVVIASLPEVGCPAVLALRWREGWFQLLRCDLFQHLNDNRQRAALWFTHEQVDMFRHHDIAETTDAITSAHLFKAIFEDATRMWRRQQRRTAITTEGEEV